MSRLEVLIFSLERLEKYYKLLDDPERYLLRKSIDELKLSEMYDIDRFTHMKTIGENIKKIILEYDKTNSISKLIVYDADRDIQAMVELTSILGVGISTAREWISKNIYTITDLRMALAKKAVKLNNMQTIGSWKEFQGAPQRPPEIFGLVWYWYNDATLKPTMVNPD